MSSPRLRRADPASPASLAAAQLRAAWEGPAPSPSGRMSVFGKTGSGKSVFIAIIFAMVKSRRIAIDIKGGAIEVDDDGSGVCYATKGPKAIDWSCRTIVYRPKDSNDLNELGEVYRQAYNLGSTTIWLDEAIGATKSSSHNKHVRDVLLRGRYRDVRHLAAAQRPVEIDTFILDSSEHVVVFGKGWGYQDLKKLADKMGEPEVAELRGDIAKARREFGRYCFLQYDEAEEELHRRPPFPSWMIETCPVHVR